MRELQEPVLVRYKTGGVYLRDAYGRIGGYGQTHEGWGWWLGGKMRRQEAGTPENAERCLLEASRIAP